MKGRSNWNRIIEELEKLDIAEIIIEEYQRTMKEKEDNNEYSLDQEEIIEIFDKLPGTIEITAFIISTVGQIKSGKFEITEDNPVIRATLLIVCFSDQTATNIESIIADLLNNLRGKSIKEAESSYRIRGLVNNIETE